jgi:hypothetical protein
MRPATIASPPVMTAEFIYPRPTMPFDFHSPHAIETGRGQADAKSRVWSLHVLSCEDQERVGMPTGRQVAEEECEKYIRMPKRRLPDSCAMT